ncbi:MurR/RpiR family transcriptional regulator [Brevibacillus sp. NRS-1366]|uniref:MurR/RpiR family transcriptional regulator n=1 Tax=Brevibacillus sp. NRS-1366 TaxID=3233899 RepID=UPI003D1E9793
MKEKELLPDEPVISGAIARLQTVIDTLPKQEKKTATFVLNNLQTFAARSIQELAAAAGVSEATYIRLSRRIGFKGFSDFKRSIIADLASFSDPVSEVLETDSAELVLEKVLRSDSQWLNDSLKVIDPVVFEQIACLILKAENIVIWAIGASAPFGLYLHQRLMRFGFVCTLMSDPYEMEVQSSVLRKDSLIIAISRTGWPDMLISACRKAKERGCTICVITGQRDTKLTQQADHVLLTATRAIRPEVLTSGIAFISLLDALYIEIAIKLKRGILREGEKDDNG